MKNRHNKSHSSHTHTKHEKPSVSRSKRVFATLAGTAVIGGLGASVEACAPNPDKNINPGVGTSQDIESNTDPSAHPEIECTRTEEDDSGAPRGPYYNFIDNYVGENETASSPMRMVLNLCEQDISSFRRVEINNAVLPFLEEHRQESLNELSSELDDPENLTGDEREAQITMNIISANLYTASKQENPVVGKNLANGIYESNSMVKNVGDFIESHGAIVQGFTVLQASKVFNSGTFKGRGGTWIDIKDGMNIQRIAVLDKDKQEEFKFVVQYYTDDRGDHATPVIILTQQGPYGMLVDDEVSNWNPEDLL